MSPPQERELRFIDQARRFMDLLADATSLTDIDTLQRRTLLLVIEETKKPDVYTVRKLVDRHKTVRVWCAATRTHVTTFAVEVSRDRFKTSFDPCSTTQN
jgi:hypothetical protein